MCCSINFSTVSSVENLWPFGHRCRRHRWPGFLSRLSVVLVLVWQVGHVIAKLGLWNYFHSEEINAVDKN
jgi:hypothetical protein